MGYNKEYDTYRPTDIERSNKMREYQKEQKVKSKNSKAENWFLGKLNQLKKERFVRFNRQSMHGTRIFDFWFHDLGIAVEIDGEYHNEEWKKDKDEKYDKYFYEVSGIVTYRVRNYNEGDAWEVIEKIKRSDLWIIRRHKMGLKIYNKKRLQEELEKENMNFYETLGLETPKDIL